MLDSLVEELDQLTAQTLENGRLIVGVETRSLQFLQTVYRSAEQPLSVRMKAAQACLPYEYPRLAVTAVIERGDMAEKLARAIAQSAKVIEARAAVPDAKPPPAMGPSPTPIKAPMATLRRM
jgi:hypothetical protein